MLHLLEKQKVPHERKWVILRAVIGEIWFYSPLDRLWSSIE